MNVEPMGNSNGPGWTTVAHGVEFMVWAPREASRAGNERLQWSACKNRVVDGEPLGFWDGETFTDATRLFPDDVVAAISAVAQQ